MTIQEMILQRIEEIDIDRNGLHDRMDEIKRNLGILMNERIAIEKCSVILKECEDQFVIWDNGIIQCKAVSDGENTMLRYTVDPNLIKYGRSPAQDALDVLNDKMSKSVPKRHIHIPHSHNAKDESLAIRQKIVQILQENEDSLNSEGVDSQTICDYIKEELDMYISRYFTVRTLYYHLSFLERNGIIEKDNFLWKLKDNSDA